MKDLTGQRFGRLVALTPSERRANREVYWLCQCDCGKQTEIVGSSLRLGRSRSCGCMNGERGVRYLRDNEWKDNTSLGNLTSNTSIANKSGRKGVWFNNKTRRYEAHITIRKKHKYLGSYDKFEDAVKAREKAEEEIFEPILNKYGRTLYENKTPNERVI